MMDTTIWFNGFACVVILAIALYLAEYLIEINRL